MGLFDHEARQFKFDVLREVALAAYDQRLDQDFADQLAYKLIPTTESLFRCCVYKEREIIRQRTRLAMGQEPNPRSLPSKRAKQIVKVIEAACDGCSIQRIQITDNCRKCMAKSCRTACKFDAISMGANRAVIDHSKCVECGACAKACPFHAIIDTPRPCKASCAVDAIDLDAFNIARIDEDRCINCAACQSACPFGAIEDQSWIVNVIEEIQTGRPTIALVAPSIQGQFDNASIEQIKTGILQIGFSDVLEVAIGADVVALAEKDELKERIANAIPMTSSCCPAFLNLARQHYPDVYAANMSTVVSPMVAMARYVKKTFPDHAVVFIGPCVAKKQEGMDGQEVDYVLTFEEIAAMLVAKHIYLEDIEPTTQAQASVFGRNFAFSGGVSNALKQALLEESNLTFTHHVADGIHECKKALTLIRANRPHAQMCEGMGCVGGCAMGPAVIDNSARLKAKFLQENKTLEHDRIDATLERFGFEDINLHRHPDA
jgi:ferredoxin hydrogenase large subunit